MKKVKVYIVMNQDERNGHKGVLWFHLRDGDVLPLQVYSEESQATKMAARKGLYKVLEAELRFK